MPNDPRREGNSVMPVPLVRPVTPMTPACDACRTGKNGSRNCLLPCLKVGDTASVCLSAMWHSKDFPAGRSVFVDPQHQCLKSPAYFQPGSAHFSAQTLKTTHFACKAKTSSLRTRNSLPHGKLINSNSQVLATFF